MSKKITEADDKKSIGDILSDLQKAGTKIVGVGSGGAEMSVNADGSSTMSGDIHDFFGKPGKDGEDGVEGGGEEDGEDKDKPEPGGKKSKKGKKRPGPSRSQDEADRKKSKGKGGEPSDEEGDGEDGEPSDKDGKDGNGKPTDKDGKDSKKPSAEQLKKAREAAEKATNDALSDKTITKGSAPEPKAPRTASGNGDGKSKANGNPGSGAGSGHAFDYTKVRPTISWKDIINKLIAAPIPQPEETYSKPSRRSITSLAQAAQSGAAALKPGEKMSEIFKPKLVIVVDGSGSMQHVVATAFANIAHLFNSNPELSEECFFLVKFSSSYQAYLCNAKHKSAVVVDLKPSVSLDASKMVGLANNNNLHQVFTSSENGGTEFYPPLTTELDEMMAKDFNVLLITDSDIVHDNNFANLLALYKKHKNKLYVILDSKDTWTQFAKAFGGAPGNFSHM